MRPLFLPTVLLLSPLLAYASNNSSDDYFDDFYGDEDIVSIATGTKKSLHMAPAVATVITADDIAKMGANNIHQVLESVTGIHAYPSKVNRMNPSYSIRGIHTDENPQVLVLVNGIRTTYEFTGAKWNQFGVGINLIDRVEVIRGPGSAVYGADAFSGVINIITKGNNSLFTNDVGVKVGSFGTKSTWVNWGQEFGDLKLSFNAQYQATGGDDDRYIDSDGHGRSGVLDTRHDLLDIHAQVDYKSFYSKLWYLDLEAGTGAGAAQVLSDSDVTSGEQFSIHSGYQFSPMEELDVDVNILFQEYDQSTYFKIFPDGYIRDGVTYNNGYIGSPRVSDTTYKVSTTAKYSAIDDHLIRVEFGHQYSEENTDEFKNFGSGIIQEGQTEQDDTLTSVKGTDAIFIGDNDRRLTYLSLQDEWTFASDWELTAGLRIDRYSDFGTTLNPRLALVWQTKHNLTTKLLYGSAYRAPSFGDLFSTNNPVKLGNENLSPENISTTELAFDYRLATDLSIALSLFKYQSKDLIDYVENQLQNTLEQDGKGAELELNWKVNSDLKLKAGYAFHQAEDSNSNTIADAPQSTLDLAIDFNFSDQFSLYVDSYWVMKRDRSAGDSRSAIDDYVWTNANLVYQYDNTRLNLSLRNVFDVEAKEPSSGAIVNDYPLESRGIWFSANYQF